MKEKQRAGRFVDRMLLLKNLLNVRNSVSRTNYSGALCYLAVALGATLESIYCSSLDVQLKVLYLFLQQRIKSLLIAVYD